MSNLTRKNAAPLSELIKYTLVRERLSSGFNLHLIGNAWNAVSGAGASTVRTFYRDGTLYVTLNSSVLRSQLSRRKAELIAAMNGILEKDEIFVKEDPNVQYIKELVLK